MNCLNANPDREEKRTTSTLISLNSLCVSLDVFVYLFIYTYNIIFIAWLIVDAPTASIPVTSHLNLQTHRLHPKHDSVFAIRKWFNFYELEYGLCVCFAKSLFVGIHDASARTRALRPFSSVRDLI